MLSSRSPVLRGQACGTTQAHLNANLALHPSRHFLYGEAVQSNDRLHAFCRSVKQALQRDWAQVRRAVRHAPKSSSGLDVAKARHAVAKGGQ